MLGEPSSKVVTRAIAECGAETVIERGAPAAIARDLEAEERLNAAIHGIGAILAVVGLIFLVSRVDAVGRSDSLAAVMIYGVALVLLFLFSAIHHTVTKPRTKHICLALDHSGIYLLIAGTYTPFGLLMPPEQQWELLAIVWGFAAVGITVQLAAFATARSDTYERFAFLYYLAMGWVPLMVAKEAVFAALTPEALSLLVAGGLAYSVGIVFYLLERLPYSHAAWHLFVVAGAAFHYFAVLHHVVPRAV